MAPRNAAEAKAWITRFEVARDGHYTHSSLWGGRDRLTSSGKFHFPEEERDTLFKCIEILYNAWQPLSLIEMCTERRPFIEDLDVLGPSHVPEISANDEQSILSDMDAIFLKTELLEVRAGILFKLFPSMEVLDLTLFSASGWHSEKARFKSSFHLVWSDLIVDKETAGRVRTCTLDELSQHSTEEPLSSILKRFRDLNALNAWDNIFDRTAVHAGSFRMPFNDKVNKTCDKWRREERPLKPVSVLRFERTTGSSPIARSVLYTTDDLVPVEWLQRGTVRRGADGSGVVLTQCIAPHQPQQQRSTQQHQQQHTSGASQSTIIEHIHEMYIDRHRAWTRPPKELREELDRSFGDPKGIKSSFEKLPSKPGEDRWQWKSSLIKGSVILRHPSGEITILGNERQQAILELKLTSITEKPSNKPLIHVHAALSSKIMARELDDAEDTDAVSIIDSYCTEKQEKRRNRWTRRAEQPLDVGHGRNVTAVRDECLRDAASCEWERYQDPVTGRCWQWCEALQKARWEDEA